VSLLNLTTSRRGKAATEGDVAKTNQNNNNNNNNNNDDMRKTLRRREMIRAETRYPS
jgi:hypothetical protein